MGEGAAAAEGRGVAAVEGRGAAGRGCGGAIVRE
jgi:hypothetical protein